MPTYYDSGSSSDCPGDIIIHRDPCCQPCCDEESHSESGINLFSGQPAECD